MRYNPKNYWFEFAIISHKVMTILTVRLGARLLGLFGQFVLLCLFNTGLIGLIFKRTPFDDGSGFEGMGKADKAELVALFAQVVNYGVGAMCLFVWYETAEEKEKVSSVDDVPVNSLPKDKENIAIAVSMSCMLLPLVYILWSAMRNTDWRGLWRRCTHCCKKCKKDTEPAEEPDELTSDTEDANDIVNFANPMHAAELNELAENESEDDAITFSNA